MEWIDNIILGLIDKYNTNDIYNLCDYLNIKIIKLNSKNVLLKGKEAFYYRDKNNKEIIFIRNDLDLNLEKFILKHELGHALCHPNLLYAGYSNTGKLERQANYFAFKLSDIKFDEAELKGMTLTQIAAYTKIPYSILKTVKS